MNFLSCTFFIFSLIIASASSQSEEETDISIVCSFSNVFYLYYEYEWSCTLYNNPGFTQPDMKIIDIENESQNRRKAEDVGIFQANSRIVRYIPKNLEVIFPRLYGLRFENTQLKYVTKEDLKPFEKLRMFVSNLNQIEFLEEDLFEYNKELEFVSFRLNQIKFIHPKVFDGIKKNLKHLWLDGTAIACGLAPAQNSDQVKTVLTRLDQSNCVKIENAPAFYIVKLKLQTSTCDPEELNTCKTELATAGTSCDAKIEKFQTSVECYAGKSTVEVMTQCMPQP